MSSSLSEAEARAPLAPARVLPAISLTSGAFGLLLLVFLLSGASGLIYQVLWQRQLALVFGVSAYATATVLAAFMAGLALGGYVAGRVADRVRSPLLWYGVVEILIGVTGLLTPIAFASLQEVYGPLYRTVGGSALAPVLRFAIAFAVLLAPTALMGASFPLVVKAALGSRDDGGRAIGLLYAINTFGAVVGTLAAGFLLIGELGVRGSIGTAAALNVVAGLLSVLVSRQAAQPAQAADAPHAAATADVRCPPTLLRLLPFLLGVSGFCSLAYEVVWTRLLVLFLETTTYAFTVMLAAFLLGITLGSAAVSPFLRRAKNGPLALVALQALVAVSSLLALQALARMEPLLVALGFATEEGPSIFAMGVLAFTAMFPPALFLGMSFPLAVTLFTAGGESVGKRLGSLYAANVFGAIFGALSAGFLLVPTLGSNLTLTLLAGLNVLAAVLTLAADSWTPTRTRLSAALVGLLVVGVLGAAAPRAYADLLAARFPGERILWSEEGLETTVTITRDRDEHLAMYMNHHHQANDADWMVFFHRMLGHLPMLLHPQPKQVLVVGLGGGATAGATTRYDGAQITVVELSQSVVRGADWFRDVNYAVTERPNVTMLVDDGRNHLLVGGHTYDVITADAIWPTHAGSTNLYSIEYYRLARRSLNPGGLMLQWVNRDLPDEDHNLMIRTFLQAFPHVSLWFDGSLLVGSDQPLDPALPWVDRLFQQPIARAALSQVNIRSGDDVRKMYVADRATLEARVGPGQIITDDRPRLEYSTKFSSNSGPRKGLQEPARQRPTPTAQPRRR
ncbi:MAG: fused MFS/spermidine synthase [Chloroflexi bacterium]|nr:fused MFS/spermidine synthase [Chloroflexota bacterium]